MLEIAKKHLVGIGCKFVKKLFDENIVLNIHTLTNIGPIKAVIETSSTANNF